ncbi:MAG: hypothetical protein IH940_02305 [Acidobacteria bacterium]|nr:hypothetical protein [Acidobacteriota bacterium]
MSPHEQRSRRSLALVVGIGVALVVSMAAGAAWIDHQRGRARVLTVLEASVVRASPALVTPHRTRRVLDSYRGQGAWVDVFDSVVAYSGEPVSIGPAVVDEMSDVGVDTLFLQAARLDDRSPDGIVDPWLLAAFLQRAHRVGIDVVGWYLPLWQHGPDMERIRAIDRFSVLGESFDGVALDIEWTGDDIDAETRSKSLVELSRTADASIRGPLGAIVVPPTLMEVVNEDFWPGFPWSQISDLYEAWLPMSYWSFRSDELGDGYTYHLDSVERLRANIGQPNALVHGIGGIGAESDPPADAPEPIASIVELGRFEQSLVDSRSAGGSIYDWATMSPQARRGFGRSFEQGTLAALGRR